MFANLLVFLSISILSRSLIRSFSSLFIFLTEFSSFSSVAAFLCLKHNIFNITYHHKMEQPPSTVDIIIIPYISSYHITMYLYSNSALMQQHYILHIIMCVHMTSTLFFGWIHLKRIQRRMHYYTFSCETLLLPST